MKKLLLAATVVVGLSSAAHASIIPTLDTIALVGSEYEFSYSATLAGDTGVTDGNRLVIFDFGGYVPGSISAGIYSADIDAFVELTSSLTPPPGFDDDPNIVNLVFEWAAAPFNSSGGPFSDVDFVGLTARSTFSITRLDGYSATSTINNGAPTGQMAYNQGSVAVPTPEPSSLALLAMGLLGMRRRPAS